MKRSFKLNNGKTISEYDRPYFIAEINSSHFGDLDLAKSMISEAKNSGINCVKFQSWSEKSLYSKTYYNENPIAKRFVKKFSLDAGELESLSNYSASIGMDFSSTPYSEEEVLFLLDNCDVPFIKIASMEINNHDYLRFIANTGSAIVLSTGMSSIEEILEAAEVIKSSGNRDLCVLHCVSVYPIEIDKINLNNIHLLRDKLPGIPIGYSDHTLGMEASFAATSIGTAIIEKHFTLDSSRIGMDNQMATEPQTFKQMIEICNQIHSSFGNYDRNLHDEELEQRLNMRRSIVSSKFIPEGKIIDRDDITFKRPGNGFKPTEISSIIGSVALKDIEEDLVILSSDFNKAIQ